MEELLVLSLVAAVVWFALNVLVGLVAERRGQSGLLWFALSLLITPIVAGLLLVAITSSRRPDRPV